MRKLGRCAWLVLLMVLLPATLTLGQEAPPIFVQKGAGEKIRLALAPFEIKGLSGPEAAKKENEIKQILSYDLEFSGLFELGANQQFIRETEEKDRKSGSVDHAEWRRLGVEAVVKGEYEPKAQGFAIRFRIFHVGSGVYVGGQEIKGPSQAAFRQAAHKVSDEVQFRLTGNQGIARTRLAFIREKGRSKELYLVDYDGDQSSVREVTRDRGIALFPSWHPSGEGIAFTSYIKHNPDLYLLDFQKRKRVPLALFPGVNYGSAFHPDGRRMLATLSKDGNSEIYELDLGNPKQPRRLTNHPGVDCSPAYSRDGKQIVFTSSRGGRPQLHIMDANGGNPQRITRGRYDDAAVWSPREDLIAYVSQNSQGNFDLCLIRPDGSELTNITMGTKKDNQSPEFSPDGRHIVFSSNWTGRYQLHAYHVYGEEKEIVRLTQLPENCTSPSWSPLPGWSPPPEGGESKKVSVDDAR